MVYFISLFALLDQLLFFFFFFFFFFFYLAVEFLAMSLGSLSPPLWPASLYGHIALLLRLLFSHSITGIYYPQVIGNICSGK